MKETPLKLANKVEDKHEGGL